MSVGEAIALVLVFVGMFFVASAALGALRFPDVFTRMHAITKAGTLGLGLVLAGAAVYFGDDLSLVTRAVAVILFALVTAPASAQMIGRAAYLSGAERAPETHLDQLAEHYAHPERLFEARPGEVPERPVPKEH
jgi:multicomponent Na+:H+ antiporter subunit G